MCSIGKDNREQNQVAMDVSRIEATRSMVADLITRGERIWEVASLKGDHGRSKCQSCNLLWVFGMTGEMGFARRCRPRVNDDLALRTRLQGLKHLVIEWLVNLSMEKTARFC